MHQLRRLTHHVHGGSVDQGIAGPAGDGDGGFGQGACRRPKPGRTDEGGCLFTRALIAAAR